MCARLSWRFHWAGVRVRYDECVGKLAPFLKSAGYNLAKHVIWVPISGLAGANIVVITHAHPVPWHVSLPHFCVPPSSRIMPLLRRVPGTLASVWFRPLMA